MVRQANVLVGVGVCICRESLCHFYANGKIFHFRDTSRPLLAAASAGSFRPPFAQIVCIEVSLCFFAFLFCLVAFAFAYKSGFV